MKKYLKENWYDLLSAGFMLIGSYGAKIIVDEAVETLIPNKLSKGKRIAVSVGAACIGGALSTVVIDEVDKTSDLIKDVYTETVETVKAKKENK